MQRTENPVFPSTVLAHGGVMDTGVSSYRARVGVSHGDRGERDKRQQREPKHFYEKNLEKIILWK
jgi:hypothetical protein